MWYRNRKIRSDSREALRATARRPGTTALSPIAEDLEDRPLLSASLAPIPDLSVPAQLGYQLPLDGSSNFGGAQLYTVTSDNPDIQVAVAQGQFWTITVSHKAANGSDVTIDHETMTFQLFGDLTPQTVARITTLTNDGYFTSSFPGESPPATAGTFIPRITSVASSGFGIVEGGSTSATSTTSSSGILPINTEPVQQLAFTGQYQIAMANGGEPDSTDAQFFITTGVLSPSIQQAFDFNYTIFGQLVSGQQTLSDLSRLAVQTSSFGELSRPITPVTINAVSLSSTNVNGVVHIDTTAALPGQSGNVTVTAADPLDGTRVSRTFSVTTSDYSGPTNPPLNFKPFAIPVEESTVENQPITIGLSGSSGYPGDRRPMQTYILVTAPSHGTLSQFNVFGTVVYTPDPGFSGVDSFQFEFQSTASAPPSEYVFSSPAPVTITVTPLPPPPPPPLVTLSGVTEVTNKHHDLTGVQVLFSGSVNPTLAVSSGTYRLALPGAKGSYNARNSQDIKLRKRVYDASSHTVTLTLRTPLALGKKAELLIFGQPPSGLTDNLGRFIDGDHNGTSGGNATVYLARSGAILR